MKGTDRPLSPAAPGARIPGARLDRYGDWLAGLIVQRAISGDFACFKFLLDCIEAPDELDLAELTGAAPSLILEVGGNDRDFGEEAHQPAA
jgi:hypothetical protein